MPKNKLISLYRMPAEWEKQRSTLVGWPQNKEDWPKRFKNIPDVSASEYFDQYGVDKDTIKFSNKFLNDTGKGNKIL